MKKIILTLSAAVLCGLSLQAQTSYEVANVLESDLNGTARFVGMGGAMSALGADISTMGTNPAGTGLYRSCDMMFSYGVNSNKQMTRFGSNRNTTLNTSGDFNNVGLVFANKVSNEGVLRFVNFGYNYHQVKNFNRDLYMEGTLGGLSQSSQMAMQTYQNDLIGDAFFDQSDAMHGFTNHNYYDDPNYGWLSLLGADSRLIDASCFDNAFYYPSDYCTFQGNESGHINEHDINLSFNFVDQVYFGVTLALTDVHHSMYSEYTEAFEGGDYFFQNWYKTIGHGTSLKVGAILRPFEESSFRVGVAATTRTVYNLHDNSSAFISTKLYNAGVDEEGNTCDLFYEMDTQSKDAFGGDCRTDYKLFTPGKINVSLGYTLESGLALGAEWEYTNYGASTLYESSGRENTAMNQHTANNFIGHNTFRFGAEKAFLDSFYARLGYNYAFGGFRTEAPDNSYKMIPINSVQTNTDYTNMKYAHNISGGFGYRGDVFYADLALVYGVQKGYFYPFDNTELSATILDRTQIKGVATIGFRF